MLQGVNPYLRLDYSCHVTSCVAAVWGVMTSDRFFCGGVDSGLNAEVNQFTR